MRIMPIVRFFGRRHALILGICLAIMLATTLVSLVIMSNNVRTVVEIMDGEMAVTEVTNAYNNLPSIAANYDMTFFIIVLSLLLIKKNRELLTTFSVTRYEQIIAGYVYILFASLALALLGKLIMPALTNAAMWLYGIKIKGGWSLSAVFMADQGNIVKTLYDSFVFMIALGGLFTLTGYIMVRWWKIILIGAAVTIIGLIVVGTQYSEARLVVYLLEHAEEIVKYIEDVVIPFIDRVLDNSDTVLYTLRYIGFSVFCTAVSYPIMRRMPVR